jgi:hypothetical protein
MSETQPGDKRPCTAAEVAENTAAFNEKSETPPSHTVIVSHFGDLRPDEVVPDTVTTCFLNQSRSVTSYIVVPKVGANAIFVANFHDHYINPPLKGQVKKRYVKKIIPSTAYLKDTPCLVMMLLCHGGLRSDVFGRPHYICFREADSVWPAGDRLRNSPEETRIWSCSEYRDRNKLYTKTPGGVTLSDVAGQANLVILLSCCSVPIVREFSAETGRKPDFVIFDVDMITHDISNHVVTALLCTSLEKCTPAVKADSWDNVVRRNVCQLLLWIKQHGGDLDQWWTFLQISDVVRKGHLPLSDAYYRIRGHAHSFKAESDDKKIVWEELRSLTLKIWHDGSGGVDRGYVDINVGVSETALVALRDGSLAFQDFQNLARAATPLYAASDEATASGLRLDALMLQLQALAHGV